MVNDLSAAGSAYAQAVGYFSASPSGQVGNANLTAPEQSLPKDPEVTITAARGSFPILSEIKDGVAHAARTINEVNKALDKADALLQNMKDRVGMVKDFPPFPPGNEERVRYIKGIDGLRKELEALSVPRVAEAYKPVFYPRESEFPELDAKVPSDSAVMAFGKAVEAIQVKVNAGRVELQAQSDQLSGRIGIDLPQSQVQNISVTVAGQLGGTSQSLVGSSDALVQLGS